MATENGFSRSVLSAAFVTLGRRLNEHRQGLADECRATASGFNVFEFIDPTENTLSDILRFLLDPTASHGQGDIFLRALVGRTRPGLLLNFAYATVARESPTYSIKQHRRRIDIVITIDGFTLAIESKKFAGEEKKQIHDYCEHLKNIAGDRFCLIFLNRTGAEASSIDPALAASLKQRGQLKNWSWEQDIPAWIVECREKCEAAKLRHFLSDFEDYIGHYLATAKHLSDEDENDNQ